MNSKPVIYLTDHVQCVPEWSWVSSSSGWKGYHIWCVEGGSTHISVCGEEYTLYSGDTFLFDLKDEHLCSHHPENPLRVSTIYFDCSGFEMKNRVVRQNLLLTESIKQILRCMDNKDSAQAALWLSALLTAFSKETAKEPPISPVVQKACQYINQHLLEPTALGTLADHTQYSKNQLIRLFHKELDCTPMQYCLQKKIAFAKSQLLYSSLSVREISDMLGFCDDSYFSKVFKAQVGCSPGNFRCQSGRQ